ncbi:FAD-dependent oxidoreductase [Pseudomaricurvus alkylphenolicus]|uniref:FAD-dependent oxidoreductase n=1 Tax=Pseudomaricurvus alkylphenolicus TaxID=1306991 RepID=UPI001423989B|nr:FAD-dependent oxidoreductase [Pseudomaricurvus alkylphenolicus]NIB44121.1 FAD-dependent oxidoreductase [Pseudomaricurvus alkylphenolicus]
METLTKDVLVVGAGGAGMTAATVAASDGLDVLLVEKTSTFGGTTAWSGGGIWVPCNSLARQAGYKDCQDQAQQYIQSVIGPSLRDDLLSVFLQAAPKMVDFLQYQSAVRFSLHEGFADWYQDLPGATLSGRLLAPQEYTGLALGEYFQRLRPPLTEFNAPAGMMIGFGDMPHIAKVKQSWQSFRHILGLVLRFGWDKIRHRRGTRLTMGNALAARLLRSCVDSGVQLWSSAPMCRLLTEGGRVIGAVVDNNGQPVKVLARHGVILAGGGFSADPALRRKFMPFPDQHLSMVCEGNDGTGIRQALELGACFDGDNISNAGWLIVSKLELPDGRIRKFPHLFSDRGKPGCIAVGLNGRRFGNESATNLVTPMHNSKAVPAYLICDHTFIKKYGLGMVKPAAIGLKKLLRAGYILRGDSLQALAEKAGIHGDNLALTVARFNQFSESGVDEDFDRGKDSDDLNLGDINHQPNPCLGPINQGPFYAVQIFPGDSTTTVGLKVDEEARVLRENGETIGGLQAIGLDMNSLWRGKAPSHGGNNTLSLTFGYVAAKALATHARSQATP